MEKNYNSPIGLVLLSALLLGLAYPGTTSHLGFLVWIGFVPIFFLWERSRSRAKIFRYFFIWGFLYFAIVFRWLLALYPLDGLGIQNPYTSIFSIMLMYVLSSGVIGAAWAGALILAQNSYQVIGLLTLATYIQAYLFGWLWWGSGSLNGSHWTFGNPAYGLASSDLSRMITGYIGTYGLVLIIVLVNYLFFLLLRKNKIRGCLILLAAMITITILPLGHEKTGQTIKISLIQTKIPSVFDMTPAQRRDALKKQLDLLDEAARTQPDTQVVVFPEATDLFTDISTLLSTSQVKNYFGGLFKTSRLIISGSRVADEKGIYSRIFALDTKHDIVGYYDKQILTPGGEFAPYIFKILLPKQITDAFSDNREFSPGPQTTPILTWQNLGFAPLVCSELLSPGFVRSAAGEAKVLVGMNSTGLFHGSSSLISQNMAMAQFRAAENQKPLIIANNYGLSYVIDSHGEIIAQTNDLEAQILTTDVLLGDEKSWYNEVGDIPILSVAVLLLGMGFLIKRNVHAT